MKTKHTPGPWQYDEDGHFVSVDMDASKMICDIRGWGWLQKMGHAKAIEVQKANAKLIAAAPDLLEALQDLINHCNISVPKGKMDYRKNAIEAIKRATE